MNSASSASSSAWRPIGSPMTGSSSPSFSGNPADFLRRESAYSLRSLSALGDGSASTPDALRAEAAVEAGLVEGVEVEGLQLAQPIVVELAEPLVARGGTGDARESVKRAAVGHVALDCGPGGADGRVGVGSRGVGDATCQEQQRKTACAR